MQRRRAGDGPERPGGGRRVDSDHRAGAPGDLRTRLAAFDRGVDDVVAVPFSPEELLARVIALVRRAYRGVVASTPVIRLGGLEIDILHGSVRAGSIECGASPAPGSRAKAARSGG